MAWYDFYKVFTYTFEDDPQSKRQKARDLTGTGISGPDVVPYANQSGDQFSSAGKGALRIGTDLVDTQTISNRTNRYKEYERLRSIPEIEQVMTVIADESCLAGDTLIQTLYDGLKSIKWLAENKKEDFFVYCWDFEKNDYALGVAYNPRLVKKEKTVKVILDDGSFFIATLDHRVLLKTAKWINSGDLKVGNQLMPFYRIDAKQELNNSKKKQFPRIFTNSKGWVHERQFIDEWKFGKDVPKYEKINQAIKMICGGLNTAQVSNLMNHTWANIDIWLKNEGFNLKEIHWLAKKPNHRRVIAVLDWNEIDVYDLSVKDHENFCGESVIFHNCQKNKKGNVVELTCENEEVVKELNFLFLHRKMLNLNRKIWSWTKRLCINGDLFLEIVINPDNPKDGILKAQELPPDSMYRIETTKSKLLEFQQGAEGADYEALTKSPVTDATDAELDQCKVIRFTPDQIVHMRLGEDRKTFYPYGQSLIEPARGPAHQLRLMEDAMVVYRLTRAPERRVFYIDVGNLPSYRAESLMTRMQDLFRKKKVVTRPGEGASAVDERWGQPDAIDDFFVPVRANSNTRIETLPGAQNLGEIDDTVYFRNKLYISLNFPPNFFASEDSNSTRVTLSSNNANFARMLERIQEHVCDGLWEIADRHLRLLGFPEEAYEDLVIKITSPSEWRDLSRMEIDNNNINNAIALKGALIMPDLDILTKILKYSEEDAIQMMSRMTLQKLQDARLQILVQNPSLGGMGVPGAGEDQLGSESDGPSPMLGPDDQNQNPDSNSQPPQGGEEPQPSADSAPKDKSNGPDLADPEPEELRRFDLEIQSYNQEQDSEDVDFSES